MPILTRADGAAKTGLTLNLLTDSNRIRYSSKTIIKGATSSGVAPFYVCVRSICKCLRRITRIYTNYNLTTDETPCHHLRPERAKALYIKFRVQIFAYHPELLPFQGARHMRIHYTQGLGSHCSPYPELSAFGPSGRKLDKYLRLKLNRVICKIC